MGNGLSSEHAEAMATAMAEKGKCQLMEKMVKTMDQQQQAAQDRLDAQNCRLAELLAQKETHGANTELISKKIAHVQSHAVAAEAEKNTVAEQLSTIRRIADEATEDKEKAVAESRQMAEKAAQLEKEKEDWAKAVKEKSEQMMRESPPPLSLKQNPPENKPLWTEVYPCFAIMGRNGTGKSSLVNAIAGKYARTVSAVGECTGVLDKDTEPAPVIITAPDGRQIALFDRVGLGAAAIHDAGGNAAFIRSQGLRWWTGVILLVDRAITSEEPLIYTLLQSVETPVVVCRNKLETDLKKNREIKAFEGSPEPTVDEFQEEARKYLSSVNLEGDKAIFIDTEEPTKYQFDKLIAWMERLSVCKEKATQ